MLKIIFRAELSKRLPQKFKTALLVVGPGASNTVVCACTKNMLSKYRYPDGDTIIVEELRESGNFDCSPSINQ